MYRNADDVLILSTGGTFNKYYDPITGELKVDPEADAVRRIVRAMRIDPEIVCIVGKDSLEMDDSDREAILQAVRDSSKQRIVIVHGTDTMERSAAYLDGKVGDKRVIFAGAMVPYSIDPVEATANLAFALAAALAADAPGVHLAMHGQLATAGRLRKNREEGRFEKVSASDRSLV
ncbi:asparaginase domain-containing protein [Nitratifractor sp.]